MSSATPSKSKGFRPLMIAMGCTLLVCAIFDWGFGRSDISNTIFQVTYPVFFGWGIYVVWHLK